MTPTIITAIATARGVESGSGLPVPWWSVTKTVLAAAALVLVAEGRLALDEALPGRFARLVPGLTVLF